LILIAQHSTAQQATKEADTDCISFPSLEGNLKEEDFNYDG
jgi:hypothetical protein